MTITIKFNTDYTTTGNESGQQIDTLAIAAGCWTLNQCEENNLEYFDEMELHAVMEYPHYERDFIATLSEVQRKAYAGNLAMFKEAQERYREQAIEQWRANPDDETPLCAHVQKERDWYYDNLRDEWLNGDRSSPGLLVSAGKYFGVTFDYDQKIDSLQATIDDDTLAEWIDDGNITKATIKQATAYLTGSINNSAVYNRNKELSKQAERRKEYERIEAYKAEQAAKEAEALRARLLGKV